VIYFYIVCLELSDKNNLENFNTSIKIQKYARNNRRASSFRRCKFEQAMDIEDSIKY